MSLFLCNQSGIAVSCSHSYEGKRHSLCSQDSSPFLHSDQYSSNKSFQFLLTNCILPHFNQATTFLIPCLQPNALTSQYPNFTFIQVLWKTSGASVHELHTDLSNTLIFEYLDPFQVLLHSSSGLYSDPHCYSAQTKSHLSASSSYSLSCFQHLFGPLFNLISTCSALIPQFSPI